MNDDIQQPQPEEQRQNTEAMPGKKKSKISPYIALFCVAVVSLTVFVEGLAIAFSFIKWREPAPNTTAFAHGVHCDTWAETPAGFQTIIETAAAKFSIRPALLAAIYKQENGQNWKPDQWSSGGWPVSPSNAQGPFQFLVGTWAGEIGKKEVQDKCDNPTAEDITNNEKASCVAAHYIAKNFQGYGITNNTMTEKEQDIKDVAVSYTGSLDYFNNWKNGNRDDSKLNQDYKDYHINVWTTFQDLDVGCQSYTSNTGNNAVEIALSEATKSWGDYHIGGQSKYTIYYQNGQSAGNWCAAFVSYVYKKAGLFKSSEGSASTVDLKKYFQDNQTFLYTTNAKTSEIPTGAVSISSVKDIKPGDVIWFNTDTVAYTRWHHVAIVKAVYDNGEIASIDGDTAGDNVTLYDQGITPYYVSINGEQKKINRLEPPRHFSDVIGVGRMK